MQCYRKARILLIAVMGFTFIAQPALACTGIMLKTNDGSIVHGRTVEFGITIVPPLQLFRVDTSS
jgi:penicillin V acylase-like amidase (Ntn superfamily)